MGVVTSVGLSNISDVYYKDIVILNFITLYKHLEIIMNISIPNTIYENCRNKVLRNPCKINPVQPIHLWFVNTSHVHDHNYNDCYL